MTVHTRSQILAQAAFPSIQRRHSSLNDKQFKEYTSFAKKFPALIHTCGLAQAVAFALAKKEMDYIADLAEVIKAAGHPEVTEQQSLEHQARTQPLSGYVRLSRDAINAAGWLKRYVEAASPDDTTETAS
jgi:CRISPR-associated protein Cmr5